MWWRIPGHRGIQRWKGVTKPGEFILTHLHNKHSLNTCYEEEKKVISDEIPLHQDLTIKIQIKTHFAEKLTC